MSEKVLMKGNEALAEAAIMAGCRLQALSEYCQHFHLQKRSDARR